MLAKQLYNLPGFFSGIWRDIDGCEVMEQLLACKVVGEEAFDGDLGSADPRKFQ